MRQRKNKKYQRNLKLRKATQQPNGAQPSAEASPAEALKEGREQKSEEEESKEQDQAASTCLQNAVQIALACDGCWQCAVQQQSVWCRGISAGT